jgi:hypothetical protein
MRLKEFMITEAADKDTVARILAASGYEDVKVKGNTVAVLVQIPDGSKNKGAFRAGILNDVLAKLQSALKTSKPEIKRDKPSLSSLGYVGFADAPTAVIIKDLGVQGDKSAGVANEMELAALIQSVVEKYGSANVKFVDTRGKSISITGVTEVIASGQDTAGGKKADVVLKSSKGSLPISVKKLDADTWESADSSFGAKARQIIDKLVKDKLVQLIPIEGNSFRLSKEIVVEPTEEEAFNAVFGSDLMPRGGIVVQTFKPEHFVQDGNNIAVACHAVIATKADIPASHLMVWLIRNNKGRLSKALGIRGLRPMASVLTRAIGRRGTKDVILVDVNGNVVANPNR